MKGLFRKQAVEWQTDRLHGDVLLLPRLSHTIILAILLLWLVAAVVWLSTSNYSRKETVFGWLESSSGVVRIYTQRPGIIKTVFVSEGESVIKDQPLMIVNGDRILKGGEHLEAILLSEYESQRKLLSAQLQRSERIYLQEKRNIEQRVASSKKDLALLDRQIKSHAQRYALVTEQGERYQKLSEQGYISAAELESTTLKELELSSEKQSLERNRVNLQNQIQQFENDLLLLPEEYANTAGQLQSRLSDLAQQIAQMHGQRAYVIKAPKAGVVSNLQAREGQQAQTTTPTMSLVPKDQLLTAQLLVPVRSAGFIGAGQPLNIRYDAFPYQKFGLFSGAVVEVSKTVILPEELLSSPVSAREPVFRVSASLDQSTVGAYGQDFQLKPGMTLTADVELAKRSLLQWLLEPIYSLKGRL